MTNQIFNFHDIYYLIYDLISYIDFIKEIARIVFQLFNQKLIKILFFFSCMPLLLQIIHVFIIRNAYPYHSAFILDIFILLYKNRN